MIRQNSLVVFDKTTINKEIWTEYYEKEFSYIHFSTTGSDERYFGNLKTFIFLGEVPNAKGHCILGDLETGKILGLYHTENFREANESEV